MDWSSWIDAWLLKTKSWVLKYSDQGFKNWCLFIDLWKKVYCKKTITKFLKKWSPGSGLIKDMKDLGSFREYIEDRWIEWFNEGTKLQTKLKELPCKGKNKKLNRLLDNKWELWWEDWCNKIRTMKKMKIDIEEEIEETVLNQIWNPSFQNF